MDSKTVNTRIQIRRDTHENWTTNDPVLSSGEMSYDSTYQEIRIGNGVDHWSDLKRIITRDTVIDLIMDTSLARDLIAEWMDANKYEIADNMLAPIMDGTWVGCYLDGAYSSPIELDMNTTETLADIDLTEYSVLYRRTSEDSPKTVTGTLSFVSPNYSLDYSNITFTNHFAIVDAGVWFQTFIQASGGVAEHFEYTFIPNLQVTTTYKIEGNLVNKIWNSLIIKVSEGA